MTDVQLLDRTRAGDDAAFDELRRRYRSDGLRAARIVAHDQDEVDQVAEDTFENLHAALAAGHGPRTAVSPQLRTMIRRHALDAHRVADDTHEALDPAAVEDLPRVPDPLADVEARNLIREAFDSLPERWQRVLWFTEVEARPANALVPDLSSAASAVAALAYRAREGLRQAYLAVHMSVAVAADCQPIVPKLPAYIREALSPEDDVTVAIHLDTCMDCRNRRYELLLLVSNLRSVLVPALLGYRAGTPAATRPVAARAAVALAAGGAAVAAGRAARTSALAAMTAVGQLPRRLIKVAATATVAILAVVALAWAASSAFAPTTSADAASGGLVRNDSPAVQFEESSDSVDTSEQAPPPAVTMDPLGLLAGLPVGEDDATTDEAGPSETNAGDNVGQPATTSSRPQASDTQNNTSGNDSNDQSDDQPSGPEPTDSTTSDSAGGGAAAGAPGGGSSGGTNDPPGNPDPNEEPAPPSGGSDDPPVADEDGGQGIVGFVCNLLPILC